MQELRLGEMIRRRREELNISQETLCEGICSRGTLSRFENGHQALSYRRTSVILQRLGLPDSWFFARLSGGELALRNAEVDFRNAGVALARASKAERPLAWARFREKLTALEALGPDDPLIRQCSLSVRAVLGGEDGAYPFEERIRMLLEAIRITVPRFDLEHIGRGLYSAEELRIVMHLAEMHIGTGQYDEALRICREGTEYLEANFKSLPQYLFLKPSFTATHANTLAWMGRYQEGLEMAEEGILAGLDTRRHHALTTCLWIKAYCHGHLGHREESARLYRQTHSLLLATREMGRIPILKEQVWELLGIELEE
ncbi:MAG: helix-turn-helix transcriptional regulator [Clostridiales bacterium]|nr:helix-turn-helix transcriptional regulator [Clostridiales bacterium]